MPEAHSLFSASGAAAWMRCPGKLVLEQGKPGSSSVYSAWGTVAHDIAAAVLEGGDEYRVIWGETIAQDTFDIELDDEMRDMVHAYATYVKSLQGADGELMVEEKVNYSEYLGVPTEQGWGTADAVIVKGKDLIVVDLKTGRGEIVDAKHNEQMSLYALGTMSLLEDVFGEFENVTMSIFQPRVGPPSEWTVKAADLKAWATSTARSAAASVQLAFLTKDKPEFNDTFLRPGEKQCRWCKASATCPKLRDEVAQTVFDTTPATPEEFDEAVAPATPGAHATEAWLSASLSKVDLIETWCTAVRAEVERRLLAGTAIPGYKLVQGKRGNRAWGNESTAEEMLKTFRLKTEEMYKLKLISPTDAEKLAKAEKIGKRQWPKLQALITQADGKPHVAPASDPRPPLDIKPAADDFADESASDFC